MSELPPMPVWLSMFMMAFGGLCVCSGLDRSLDPSMLLYVLGISFCMVGLLEFLYTVYYEPRRHRFRT